MSSFGGKADMESSTALSANPGTALRTGHSRTLTCSSGSRRRSLLPKVETDNTVKQAGATFTIVLQAEPHIDAIRNLRVALKVLKRRYGLRVVTIRETPHQICPRCVRENFGILILASEVTQRRALIHRKDAPDGPA